VQARTLIQQNFGGLSSAAPIVVVHSSTLRTTAPSFRSTVAKAEAIKKQLEGRGHPMELHTYDAQHAFMNDTRPEVYSPANAKLAWDRTVAFFKKHLS
jgi:dienelactone hydrolase